MAHIKKEVTVMGNIRYEVLLLLSWLLASLSGCSFRDMEDDYPVSGVQIKLDWTGVTDKLPETMRVIFYPKDAEGRKVDSYLSAAGGDLKVPPGNYSVVVYNFNTESIQIRGEESFDKIEAFTGHCTGLGVDEDMVWSPDALYAVTLDDVEIKKSDVALQMNLKPEAVVRSYSFDIKVKGFKNVSGIICYVSGTSGRYYLGKQVFEQSEAPIYVDTKREGELLWGYFSNFALPGSLETRSASQMMLTVKLIKIDNTVQETKVDITELLETPPDEGGGDDPDDEVHIEVPVPDGEIVVDDVETGGNGGINGDVGDWDDETDVVLPV